MCVHYPRLSVELVPDIETSNWHSHTVLPEGLSVMGAKCSLWFGEYQRRHLLFGLTRSFLNDTGKS